MKQNRAHRVVIGDPCCSLSLGEIKEEVEDNGHTVRNLINIGHKINKQPFMSFCVDVELNRDNKEIYNTQSLNDMQIRIESPHRRKHIVVQCVHFQLYGHSISYCTLPFQGIKC